MAVTRRGREQALGGAGQVGFHLDHDIVPGPGMRVAQLTPPGSPCSVVMGVGMPLGEPGATKGLQLVVEDRAEWR